MARNNLKLVFYFEPSKLYYCNEVECMFCQTEYPIPPAVITLSSFLRNGSICDSGWVMCSACALSNAKTLAETCRATVERNRVKAKEIRAKVEKDRTENEQGFLRGDSDYSSDLKEIANNLDRLGDVSKIINHDLAVVIAKHYTGKRTRKAA